MEAPEVRKALRAAPVDPKDDEEPPRKKSKGKGKGKKKVKDTSQVAEAVATAAAAPEPTACMEKEPKNAAPDAAVPQPTACVETEPNANAAPDAAVPLEHQSRWHEIVPGIHSASVLQVGKFSIITSYS